MFLLVEAQKSGLVKGESNDKTHKAEIEVLDWSWGMSSSSTLGGAGSALKTSLSELRIVKRVDTASTALMSIMRNNDLIKKAVLTVRKAGGTQIEYFTLTIEKGRITAFDVASDSASGPHLNERFSIAFEKIDVQYTAQDETGARKGASSFSADVR